jgi:hypothetical protein
MATDPNDDATIGGDDKPNRTTGHAQRSNKGLGAATMPENAEAPKRVARSEEDPRERAAKRAAEILEHRGNMDEGDDEFFIDQRVVPDGWSYEWKRHTILGAEDPSYQVHLARGGWEAVPAYRHPEMMPGGWKGNNIERKGMLLMERPAEITDASKAMELRKARDQVRQKEVQLHGSPAGENSPFAKDNKGAPLVKIAKSYERMPIPSDK